MAPAPLPLRVSRPVTRVQLGAAQANWIAAAGCVLLLAGCSTSFVTDSAPAVQAPPELEYKQITVEKALPQFRGERPTALEISALVASSSLQPGDWMACLRGVEQAQPVYYSVFFRNHDMTQMRRAVVVDKCEAQEYGPLPRPPPPPAKTAVPPSAKPPAKPIAARPRQD